MIGYRLANIRPEPVKSTYSKCYEANSDDGQIGYPKPGVWVLIESAGEKWVSAKLNKAFLHSLPNFGQIR